MKQQKTEPAISLRGISKSYDGRAVLHDLWLDVEPGEFLAIVGPSGSGKTTVMRLIGGFEAPERGRVFIAGEDVTALPAERRKVNTVFQSYALFPHLSVLENVAYGPRMQGASRRQRQDKARQFLDLVRLPDAALRRPQELSGGMQQRVALARALANDPTVLLLDEPLGALDRKLRDEMQRELRRVQAELGATFIYVTHDQDEAFGMADRLAVMRAGRLEQVGTPGEVYDAPANAWVALFLGSANTFRARLERRATPNLLAADFGPITAGYVADELGAGDLALVAVRPEATTFEPVDPQAAPAPNRIAARLVDVVTIGPSIRQRAVTSGGQAFESVTHRDGEASFVPALGDAVHVRFSPQAVRAYRDEPTH
ncbi:ABC transporter ATP-binding protein [Oryzibacter oryziterrae]|uniref:ABC transporter ATP-binding protein n=1 Tax=Oryzibacter oryziterrae TaxID=2766474 RepID=UPI001F308AEE|nr:ABC transporter ATP-binding protein [Oryzibacter oryziterrae]